MKKDVILYEKIYENLKYKIESGIFQGGYKLPSRANMCKEYNTSEKPVRIAIEMLVQDGLVTARQRKRPTVAYNQNIVQKSARRSVEKAAATETNDALKSGILLCYPIIGYGISLCKEEDFTVPQTIIEHMNPEEITTFWNLSNKLWRFFVARTGNEFILRTVSSMGCAEMVSLIGDYEVRSRYLSTLKEFIQTVKAGGDPADVRFGDMSFVYGSDTPCAAQLEVKIRKGEERYSNVYLDLIGLIEIGCYSKGDMLPSHKELQKIYGVSIDTTLKAIKILKDWGVVKTAPHKGILVTMGREELKQVPLDSKLIACHLRRFLDSLEFLTLVIEGIAIHAMEDVDKEEVRQLRTDVENQWNDPVMYHFYPSFLLKFIIKHIKYEMLRSICEILLQNFRIGRSIPKLIGREKTGMDYENYRICLEAVECLETGNIQGFSTRNQELFQDIQEQIIAACKKIGFWEAAMQVYDGDALWR